MNKNRSTELFFAYKNLDISKFRKLINDHDGSNIFTKYGDFLLSSIIQSETCPYMNLKFVEEIIKYDVHKKK